MHKVEVSSVNSGYKNSGEESIERPHSNLQWHNFPIGTISLTLESLKLALGSEEHVFLKL